MIEQIKTGDKLTIIRIGGLAATVIYEITVDSISKNRVIYAQKRKKFYLNIGNDTLVLKGHSLGIKQGTWNNGNCFLMDANINLGGLDRETMITLLKTNINEAFNEWERIYWFDGTSEKGDPIFMPHPVSDNYLKYREQAEKNKSKSAEQIAVGDFIYCYIKSSKHQDLMDMLKTHLQVDETGKEYFQLGKVVDVIDISESEFDSLEYSEDTNLLKDKGGSYSDDIAEDREIYSLSPFERETFYSHFTLIRTPSGRAIVADAQGYSYMRYTGLLSHYRLSMKADCDKANELLRLANEKAKEERIQKEKEETRLKNEIIARIEKEFSSLTVVTDTYDYTTIANNLRKVLKLKFPYTKFSVVKKHIGYYYVQWTDGPTVEQVNKVTNLFEGRGFDASTDLSSTINSLFRDRYGYIEFISTYRKVSELHKKEELEVINKELGTAYTIRDFVTERGEYMERLVYQQTCCKDYSPEIKPEEKENVAQQAITAKNIEIVDYSDKAFAIIGNTKPLKGTLSALHGRFNANLSCGPGWIFPKSKIDTVKQTLNIK